MIVFWAESGKEEYQKTFMSWMNPQVDNQEEMKKLFGNLQRGLRVDLEDIKLNLEQKFYILCLAPNVARLSVRFFYQNSFGNIMENLSKHYQRMEIVKPAWVELDYLGIQKMLFETVNQKSKDKTPIPSMAAMVLNAVLQNNRYPATLYTDTLIRIRSEQGNITCGRAAIISSFNEELQLEGRRKIHGIERGLQRDSLCSWKIVRGIGIYSKRGESRN